MKTFRHPDSVTALTYTPDGATLFSADTGEAVRAWDPLTGNHVVIHQNSNEVPWVIENLAVSPNGKKLLIGRLVCRIGRLPAPTRPVAFHNLEHSGRFRLASGWTAMLMHECRRAVFSPNSHLLAGENGMGGIRVWRVANGQRMADCNHESSHTVPCFSPDGKTLVSVFTDGKEDTGLAQWDVKTLTLRQTVRVHYDAIDIDSIPLYSPDGRWLAVASGDKIHLHDPRSRVLAWQGALQHHSVAHINTIAFSPDSKQLLTGGSDRQDSPVVCLWDVHAGQPIATWDWQIGRVNQVAFAPDGMTAAAAGSDRLLVIWDLDW